MIEEAIRSAVGRLNEGVAAVFIQSHSGIDAPGPQVELRKAVIESLVDLGVSVSVSLLSNLTSHVHGIPQEKTLVVFCEIGNEVAKIRKLLGNRSRVRYCVLTIPTSFAPWGDEKPDWQTRLDGKSLESVTFVTNSTLARSAVESYLDGFRADARVVETGQTGDQRPLGWTFESSAKWTTGAAMPVFRATGWGFEDLVEPGGSRELRSPAVVDARADVNRRTRNQRVVWDVIAPPPADNVGQRVAIMGHKLTFIDELARDFHQRTGSPVTLDEWKYLGVPDDVEHSRSLISAADVIVGEWARPNNVWIQKNADQSKRLIVRAHRYEVTTEFPRNIDMDRFFAGVVIVPWVGRALVQKFSWPQEKLVYIPNYVNSRYFKREKLPGAEFTLGIAGITPDLKRLDLALDLLRALREIDARYTLRVRGSLPTQHIHWSTNPKIPEQWGSILFRLRVDPLLRNGVFFDAPGRDMASWFEGVGVILSTSDLEGSHVALAEGMASGAVPIARNWPGIKTLWPADIVFSSVDAAAERVLSTRNPQVRAEIIDRMQVHPSLDQDRVLDAWQLLIGGDRSAAQAVFGTIDWQAPWYESTAGVDGEVS